MINSSLIFPIQAADSTQVSSKEVHHHVTYMNKNTAFRFLPWLENDFTSRAEVCHWPDLSSLIHWTCLYIERGLEVCWYSNKFVSSNTRLTPHCTWLAHYAILSVRATVRLIRWHHWKERKERQNKITSLLDHKCGKTCMIGIMLASCYLAYSQSCYESWNAWLLARRRKYAAHWSFYLANIPSNYYI